MADKKKYRVKVSILANMHGFVEGMATNESEAMQAVLREKIGDIAYQYDGTEEGSEEVETIEEVR